MFPHCYGAEYAKKNFSLRNFKRTMAIHGGGEGKPKKMVRVLKCTLLYNIKDYVSPLQWGGIREKQLFAS